MPFTITQTIPFCLTQAGSLWLGFLTSPLLGFYPLFWQMHLPATSWIKVHEKSHLNLVYLKWLLLHLHIKWQLDSTESFSSPSINWESFHCFIVSCAATGDSDAIPVANHSKSFMFNIFLFMSGALKFHNIASMWVF